MSSGKVILHLSPPSTSKDPGPCVSSPFMHVKFSFKDGGHFEFYTKLVEQLSQKSWEKSASAVVSGMKSGGIGKPGAKPRGVGGIVGIERKLEQQSRETDESINRAFKDLDALMEKAK